MNKIVLNGRSLNWEEVRHVLYALPKIVHNGMPIDIGTPHLEPMERLAKLFEANSDARGEPIESQLELAKACAICLRVENLLKTADVIAALSGKGEGEKTQFLAAKNILTKALNSNDVSIAESLKYLNSADNVERILAKELLSACQAIDPIAAEKALPSKVRAVYEYVRKRIPALKEDKYLSSQLELAYNLVETGVLIDVSQKA